MMKIYIDAGHGGKDPGAIYDGEDRIYYESGITMAGAFMLAGSLHLMNHDTIISRRRDEYVSLRRRKNEANKSRADLFVSVHCNAFGRKDVRGIEVLYYPGVSTAGRLLAGNIIAVMKHRVVWSVTHGDGVVGRSDLYVLRKTKMPAIIVELGYITNVHDRAALLDHWKLSELMRVIAETIGNRQTAELLRDFG